MKKMIAYLVTIMIVTMFTACDSVINTSKNDNSTTTIDNSDNSVDTTEITTTNTDTNPTVATGSITSNGSYGTGSATPCSLNANVTGLNLERTDFAVTVTPDIPLTVVTDDVPSGLEMKIEGVLPENTTGAEKEYEFKLSQDVNGTIKTLDTYVYKQPTL